MKPTVNFKCTGDNLEKIPQDIIDNTGLSFPKAHANKKDIAILAKALKEDKNDKICRVPFCVTVEAEALGADIKLGDNKRGPRVNNYLFSSVEDLVDIEELDLTKGRIREVLDAVETLNKEGELVALSVEGPFTIVSSLIDPMDFYRGIRKNKEVVNQFMEVIEDNIVKYILTGINKGAKIISYADPVGAIDIVGPKIYKDLSGQITYNVLKKVEDRLDGTIVHLCAKTSIAFEDLGFIKSVPRKIKAGISYGEAISKLLKNHKDIKFIGHKCIKMTPMKKERDFIWVLELDNNF
ncbi:MtaA/CmuA family methyltransferase [Halanaerobium saccharolyticum]|uniref:MtaA/CmuA family methyltransferase n=1 Tax=Halanaerobium saccharolyticum TaxID=43595 RepID=A0A4R6LRM3_9FIRM|nr:uroporphyrinogen decarboxylase family protein [Halanaerobium saccharolyticum]TDO90121.1 MtaA/CmuA family methyltransferase [Halanaerobium saccharolyticum]